MPLLHGLSSNPCPEVTPSTLTQRIFNIVLTFRLMTFLHTLTRYNFESFLLYSVVTWFVHLNLPSLIFPTITVKRTIHDVLFMKLSLYSRPPWVLIFSLGIYSQIFLGYIPQNNNHNSHYHVLRIYYILVNACFIIMLVNSITFITLLKIFILDSGSHIFV